MNYFDITTTISKYPDKAFPFGNVMLTTAGEILKRCVTQRIIPKYMEYIVSEIGKNRSVEISERKEIQITYEEDSFLR